MPFRSMVKVPSSDCTETHCGRSGNPEGEYFILSSGNVLELDGQDAKVTGSVHTGAIFVDEGLGVGDVKYHASAPLKMES